MNYKLTSYFTNFVLFSCTNPERKLPGKMVEQHVNSSSLEETTRLLLLLLHLRSLLFLILILQKFTSSKIEYTSQKKDMVGCRYFEFKMKII